jgi:hypothetical protein
MVLFGTTLSFMVVKSSLAKMLAEKQQIWVLMEEGKEPAICNQMTLDFFESFHTKYRL